MLITSLRFYERILLGLHDPDAEIRELAQGCMSYLVVHMKNKFLRLPPPVVAMLSRLPEGTQ